MLDLGRWILEAKEFYMGYFRGKYREEISIVCVEDIFIMIVREKYLEVNGIMMVFSKRKKIIYLY